MNCYRCGSELYSGDKFCRKCGAPLPEGFDIVEAEVTAVSEENASGLPAEAPVEQLPCDAAEAEAAESVEETAAAAAPYEEVKDAAPKAEEPAAEPAEAPKKKHKAGKWIFTLLVVILACLVLAGALFYFLVLNRRPAKGYAYVTQDGQFYASSSLKGGDKGYLLSDDASANESWCEFSKDGRFVYYMTPGPAGDETDMELYRAEMSMLGSSGYEPEKISGGVYGYGGIHPAGDGVLYIRYEGKNLRYYNGYENVMLAKEADYVEVSEDGKTVFYESFDENGYETGYRIDLASGDSVKLFEGASLVYSMLTDPHIVYVTDSEDSDGYSSDIFVISPDGTTEKAVSGASTINSIASNTADELVFYYSVEKEEEKSLLDFVSDNLKLADTDPKIPAEYDLNCYDLYEIYYEDGQWTYEDYYNDEHHPFTATDEELTNAGVDPADYAAMEEPSYGFMFDLINDVLTQRYYENEDEIKAAYIEFYDAEYRNYLRETLAEESYYLYEGELHEYRNGSDSVMASGIDLSTLRYDDACSVFIYEKAPSHDEQVIDIRDIEDPENVYDAIYEAYNSEADYFVLVGGAESELDFDKGSYIDSVYSLAGGEYFILSNSGSNGGVISAYKAGNGLVFEKVIADDVYNQPAVFGQDGSEKLYFMSGYSEESISADLYSYAKGQAEIIGRGLSHAVFFENGEVYTFTDCYLKDDYENCGTLNKAVGGEPLEICKDVETWNVYADGSGNIFYLTSEGDLMLWNGKENARITRFAERFWMYGAMDFDWLMCF